MHLVESIYWSQVITTSEVQAILARCDILCRYYDTQLETHC